MSSSQLLGTIWSRSGCGQLSSHASAVSIARPQQTFEALLKDASDTVFPGKVADKQFTLLDFFGEVFWGVLGSGKHGLRRTHLLLEEGKNTLHVALQRLIKVRYG